MLALPTLVIQQGSSALSLSLHVGKPSINPYHICWHRIILSVSALIRFLRCIHLL